MPDKIRVIVKRPGQLPVIEMIDNTLEAMQKIVGGHIEAVTYDPLSAFVVNEDGISSCLRHNFNVRLPERVCVTQFYGNVIFCGVDGDEFCDTPLDVAAWRALFGVIR